MLSASGTWLSYILQELSNERDNSSCFLDLHFYSFFSFIICFFSRFFLDLLLVWHGSFPIKKCFLYFFFTFSIPSSFLLFFSPLLMHLLLFSLYFFLISSTFYSFLLGLYSFFSPYPFFLPFSFSYSTSLTSILSFKFFPFIFLFSRKKHRSRALGVER